MEESILKDIKKLLGCPDYEHYDVDVVIHINTALGTLTQLGVGPKEGYFITGETERWIDFIGENYKNFQGVKTYVYLKVKLIFDPPQNTSAVESINKTIKELEWRLNLNAEEGK